MRIAIKKISVGARHRKDMGDLQPLAESISAQGLLQPVGITPDNTLVFGQRRLLAIRDVLKQKTIDARVVNVSSIAAGEYAENEVRKDFSPMERVAIGRTLEVELGGRQGQRTDLEPVDVGPQVDAGEKTRDVIAKKVGFGSGREYDRAKQVADKGSKPLQDAVDSGKIPVSSAAKLVDLPKAEQTRIAKSENPKAEARKAAVNNKPAPDYSDILAGAFRELSDRIDSVVEQYGSLKAMFDSKAWRDCDCRYVIEMVHELRTLFTKLDTEARKYAKAKGLT